MKHYQAIFNLNKLLLLALALALMSACDSQKRVSKALLKLEKSDEYKKTRSWPQNYTFGEYSEQLDDAKLRKAFYEKRKTQAIIAKNRKMVDVMQNNIEQYDKTIDRLKSDKKFYKIYKLRSKKVKLKIKEENKTKRALEKQKSKLDRKAIRANKEKLKKHKKNNREQARKVKEKRKELEKRKDNVIKKKEAHLKQIEDKRKEIKRLEKLKEKASITAQSSYTKHIQLLRNEISVLVEQSQTFNAPIKSLEQKMAQPDSVLQHPIDNKKQSQE